MVACIAIIKTAPFWRPVSIAVGPPVAQYAQALGPVAFGVVGAAAIASVRRTLATVSLAAFVVMAAPQNLDLGIPYAIGCAAFLFAALGSRLVPFVSAKINAVADLTFGVYLVHPLFLTAFWPDPAGGSIRARVRRVRFRAGPTAALRQFELSRLIS